MCARLLRLKKYVIEACEKKIFEEQMNLVEEQWRTISLVTEVLKPFRQTQKMLEGEKYSTLSLVPMSLHTLKLHLNRKIVSLQQSLSTHDVSSTRAVITLCKCMQAKFFEEFNNENGFKVYPDSRNMPKTGTGRARGLPIATFIAALLDPRTKDGLVQCLAEDQIDVVWATIKSLANDVAMPQQNHTGLDQHNVSQNVDLESAMNLLLGCDGAPTVANLAPPNHNVTEQSSMIDIEIQSYKVTTPLPLIANIQTTTDAFYVYDDDEDDDTESSSRVAYNDPLKWWQEKSSLYPLLAKLSQKFLAIPATSAPSERLFSIAGITIANDRSSMLPVIASEEIFLRTNWKKIQEWDLTF